MDITLGVVEAQFADIIWKNEPISSTELALRSGEILGWKKSTAFTVLRRLCDKGLFQNQKGQVTSLLSREEFYAAQSQRFVEETFDGSLPAFLVAFSSRKKLTPEEVEELRRLVEQYEGVSS